MWNYGRPDMLTTECNFNPTFYARSEIADDSEAEIITSKFCLVCNAPNASPHYGTLSCMSCKAFFRRCVRKNMQEKCISGNNACVMSMQYRSRCRSCRYRACLTAGMKKEGVSLVPQPSPKKKLKAAGVKGPKVSVCSMDSNTSAQSTSSAATLSPPIAPISPASAAGGNNWTSSTMQQDPYSTHFFPDCHNSNSFLHSSSFDAGESSYYGSIMEHPTAQASSVNPCWDMYYSSSSTNNCPYTNLDVAVKPEGWMSSWLRYYQQVDQSPNQDVAKLARFLKKIEFKVDEGLFSKPALYKRATVVDFVEQFEEYMEVVIDHLKTASMLSLLPMDEQVMIFQEALLPTFLFTMGMRSLQFENALLVSTLRGFVVTDSASPPEFRDFVKTVIEELVMPLRKLQLDDFEAMSLSAVIIWNPDLMETSNAQALVWRLRQHMCSGIENYVFNKRLPGRLSEIVYLINKIQKLLVPARHCFSGLLQSGRLRCGQIFEEVIHGGRSRQLPSLTVL